MRTPAPDPTGSLGRDLATGRAWSENAHSLAILLGLDGTIVDLNQQMADTLGQPIEELKGTLLWHQPVFASGAEWQGPFQKVLEAHNALRLNTEYGGRWYDTSFTPCLDSSGKAIGVTIVGWDITERRQAEEAQARLAAIVEGSGDAIISKTLEGVVLTWNSAAERMFGYRAEEIIGQSIRLLLPEERRSEEEWILERLLQGEKFQDYETVRVAKDGRRIEVSLTVSPLKDKAGNLMGASKILRDITERKQTEIKLRETNDYLENLINHANAPIVVWDPQFRITRFNHAFEFLTGRSEAEVRGQSLELLFPPALVESSMALIRGTLSGERWEVVEIRIQHRDGSERTVLWNSATLFAPDGQTPLAIIAQGQDITERKRAEFQITERRKELEALFGLAKLGAKTGITLDEIYQDLVNLLPASWQYPEVTCARIIIGDSDFRTRNFKLSAWMQSVPVRVKGAVVGRLEVGYLEERPEEDEGPFFKEEQDLIEALASQIGILTERKRAEAAKEEMEAQNRQLQKAESLGRMAGAIAHSFNNQLAAAIMNLELLQQELPPNAGSGLDLSRALQSARAAASISTQMLVYLGQSHVQREALDLSEACRQSLPLLEAAIPHNVVLKTDLPAPGPVIKANANQIQQVLTSLITNAWEASSRPQDGIRVTVKLAPATEISAAHRFPVGWQPQDSAYACLEVADSGRGIAAGDIENIFDPFFTSKFTGRGLGLAVVLGIVRGYDGGITVESEPGQGSVFRVFLPVSAASVPQKPIRVAPAPKTADCGGVLVVDDETPLRVTAARALQRVGYTVFAAADGVEAVELFEQHREEIHCVLCDLTMPRMGGWETLTALRKLAPRIPIILSSGYDDAKVMEGQHTELPQAFLRKPYELKALFDLVKRLQPEVPGKKRE